MSEDTLTDFPEIDAADMTEATGIEPPADPAPDELPQDEPADDAGDDDPDAPPAEPAADPQGNLPDYRREAIANRENRELRAQLDRLEKLITEGKTPPPVASLATEGEAITPEMQALHARFFKAFPSAQKLFEKADAILRAAEVAPNLASQAEEAENARAHTAIDSVITSVAVRALGAGKTGTDLRPQTRERISSAFATWCGAQYATDTSQMPKEMVARAIRYQNGDQKLFDEFAKDYLSDFTPAHRQERVDTVRRATAKSPRGGPASAPPPVGPKPPDPNDPDAIHKGAWDSMRADAAAR